MNTIVNRTEDNFTKFVKLIDEQFQMMATHNLYKHNKIDKVIWIIISILWGVEAICTI